MELKKLPKIALGAWARGNDGTFGGSLSADDLRPVFEAGMKAGLNLWDTAYAYGMGASERVLGDFIKGYPREDVILSDKFTPQCADPSAENAVTELSLLNRSSETSGILDYCCPESMIPGIPSRQIPTGARCITPCCRSWM